MRGIYLLYNLLGRHKIHLRKKMVHLNFLSSNRYVCCKLMVAISKAHDSTMKQAIFRAEGSAIQ